MALKVIWQRFRLYKRFEKDIWGQYLLDTARTGRLSRLFLFWADDAENKRRRRRMRYIYRIDMSTPNRIIRRQKKEFVTRKLIRLFYLTLSYAQFRKLKNTASRLEGSWEGNFIMLLENRLIFMIYRMQIQMNVFALRQFVLRRLVYIDNKYVSYVNAPVSALSILTLDSLIALEHRYSIKKRFKAGSFYFGIPRYMIINYKLMFGFVFRDPTQADVSFPLRFYDVFRGSDIN